MKLLGLHSLPLLFIMFFSTLGSLNNDSKYTFASIKKAHTHKAVTNMPKDYNELLSMITNSSGTYNYNNIHHKNFKQIRNDDTSINNSLVYTMFMDSSNRLWAGTEDGLNVYNKGLNRFIKVNLTKESNIDRKLNVCAIVENNKGILIIGTNNQGLFKLDAKTLKSEPIVFAPPYQQADILMNSIVQDKMGNMLIGSSKGLFIYQNNDAPIKLASIKTGTGIRTISESVQSLLKDSENHIWVGTVTDGLLKIEWSNESYNEVFNYAISDKRILSMVEIPNGHILCGAENEGLFVLDSNGAIHNKL